MSPVSARVPFADHEAFRDWVGRPDPQPPAELTHAKVRALAQAAREDHLWELDAWNTRDVLLNAPGVELFVKALLSAVRLSIVGGAARVPCAVALSGVPQLGKTTAALEGARRVHEMCLRRFGTRMENGCDRVPVAFVSLADSTTPKALVRQLLAYYGLAPSPRLSEAELRQILLDAIARCGTTTVFLDDAHFIDADTVRRRTVVDFLKGLMSNTGCVLVVIGIDLASGPLLGEGYTAGDIQRRAQFAGRARLVPLDPVDLATAESRQTWGRIVSAFIDDLRLLGPKPRVDKSLARWLNVRARGRIGLLAQIIHSAASIANHDDAQAKRPEGLTQDRLAALPPMLVDDAAKPRGALKPAA